MIADDSFGLLMGRLQIGDAEAAGILFHRFAQRLIALARQRLEPRLRSKVDPEDILQSVFKSFFRRREHGEFALGGWDGLWALLSVITVRKCGAQVDHFHALVRDVKREVKELDAADSAASWQGLAREPTPAEAAMLAETVERLLRDLTQREREIVSLALQGCTASEISAELRRPQRTVNRVLERTRKRLERQWASDLEVP